MSLATFARLRSHVWAKAIGVSVVALALAWALMQMEAFRRLSLYMGDLQAAALASDESLDDLLIVDIDEQSMAKLRDKLGVWPYSRHIYARATRFLREAGVRAIVYDIVFSEQRDGDDEFAQELSATPNVALAAAIIARSPQLEANDLQDLQRLAWPAEVPPPGVQLDGITLPRRVFMQNSRTHVGVIRVIPDSDGHLRKVPLVHKVHGQYVPSLALAAAYAGGEKPAISYDARTKEIGVGGRVYPVTASGEVLLRFPRDLNSIDVLPFHQLVAAIESPEAHQSMLRRLSGKRVFIGSSSAVLGDTVLTRYGEIPGLLGLAAATGLLERDQVLRPPSLGNEALLAVIAACVPLLAFRRTSAANPWRSLLMLAVSIGLTLLLCATLYQQGRANDPVFPLLSALLVFGSLTLLRLFMLYRERQRLAMEKMAAENAYELKSQFISQMTHELRTPLAAIMGFNKLLTESGISDRNRDQYSRVITKNSDHLMTLINNMLDQSKLEAGQIKINKAPVRIREVVDDVVTTLSTLARDKNLKLQASYDAQLPQVLEVDAFRLRQVLINLVGNAIKFTNEGSVRVDAAWRDGQLLLQVADTGPGIPRSALQRIFEPFQQGTDSTERVHGGTGLGLTISRNMCRLMDGGLDVDSTLGKGSTFKVGLMARECPAAVVTSETTPATAASDEKLSGTVLLADDNADIRELVSRYLVRMGLTVVPAKDGAEAVALAGQHDIQVVLLDMEMPVMRGTTAATRLRASGFARPILMITAHPEGPEVEQALRDGCDGYIGKPVNRERLFATLRALLQREAPRDAHPAKLQVLQR